MATIECWGGPLDGKTFKVPGEPDQVEDTLGHVIYVPTVTIRHGRRIYKLR